MRITKKILSKSNERKNVVIFILLAIVFIMSMIVSVQFNDLKNEIDNLKEIVCINVAKTDEIKNILTLGEGK